MDENKIVVFKTAIKLAIKRRKKSTYMLLKWNIVRDKCFGKNHAVLKVNISVGHSMS